MGKMEPLVSGDIPAQCRDRFSNSGGFVKGWIAKGWVHCELSRFVGASFVPSSFDFWIDKSGLIFTESIGRAKSGGPLSAWVTILGLFKLTVQGWSDLEPNDKYVTITMTWTTSRKFCRAQADSGFRGSVSEQIGAYAGARAARVARDSCPGLRFRWKSILKMARFALTLSILDQWDLWVL